MFEPVQSARGTQKVKQVIISLNLRNECLSKDRTYVLYADVTSVHFAELRKRVRIPAPAERTTCAETIRAHAQ